MLQRVRTVSSRAHNYGWVGCMTNDLLLLWITRESGLMPGKRLGWTRKSIIRRLIAIPFPNFGGSPFHDAWKLEAFREAFRGRTEITLMVVDTLGGSDDRAS